MRQLAAARPSFSLSLSLTHLRHGAWAEAEYNPLEAEFLKKLKAIDGVSQVGGGSDMALW